MIPSFVLLSKHIFMNVYLILHMPFWTKQTKRYVWSILPCISVPVLRPNNCLGKRPPSSCAKHRHLLIPWESEFAVVRICCNLPERGDALYCQRSDRIDHPTAWLSSRFDWPKRAVLSPCPPTLWTRMSEAAVTFVDGLGGHTRQKNMERPQSYRCQMTRKREIYYAAPSE